MPSQLAPAVATKVTSFASTIPSSAASIRVMLADVSSTPERSEKYSLVVWFGVNTPWSMRRVLMLEPPEAFQTMSPKAKCFMPFKKNPLATGRHSYRRRAGEHLGLLVLAHGLDVSLENREVTLRLKLTRLVRIDMPDASGREKP